MTTYYVSKTGNNGNGLSLANAKTTIAAGLALLSSGDTLLINDGTYTEGIFDTIPAGISASQETLIQAINSNLVIVNGVNAFGNIVTIFNKNYIRLKDIIFDGANATDDYLVTFRTTGTTGDPGCHFCVIEGGKIRNFTATNAQSGIFLANANSFCEMINIEVYNISSPSPFGNGTHGIYIRGTDHIVRNCIIRDNSYWGIHQYEDNTETSHRCVFKNNKVYGNKSGIRIGDGNDNIAFNNLIYDNNNNFIPSSDHPGIVISNGSRNHVYNNTIYGHNTWSILIFLGSGAVVDPIIRNNILFANANDDIATFGGSPTNLVEDHNLKGTNPLFVDETNKDFHLTSSSPAINAGFNLAGIVDFDYDGIVRPQTSIWDIGAYEFSNPTTGSLLLNIRDTLNKRIVSSQIF